MRAAVLAIALLAIPTASLKALPERWPEPGTEAGLPVQFPSRSPFTPAQVADAKAITATATFFAAAGAAPGRPVPAVVLLHGSGGVLVARETAYARQLAAQGVAALVVDSFGPRSDLATGYVDRLLAITETMIAADAYAALAWLGARPGIDMARVALVGFSYGGLAAVHAVNEGVVKALAQGPERFAGHVAYYAPCIGEFADPRTTGVPMLLLAGARDETFDAGQCDGLVAQLRAGGSDTRLVVHEDAYHQWDGRLGSDWRPSRGIRGCRFRLETDGTVRDLRTRLGMNGRTSRTLSLALCTDGDGYTIRSDPAVRARSTAELARFLNRVFGNAAMQPAG